MNDGPSPDASVGAMSAPNSPAGWAEASGDEVRFSFGSNWQHFLQHVDEERIRQAEGSLQDMLGVDTLEGRSFLDVGCGSGLFSLAAVRLGASRVHSTDFDLGCVACTEELRGRFAPDASQWTVEQGSALDEEGMAALGTWDVVYSWGVLHHTGNLWRSFELIGRAVSPGGQLFLSIGNDQGARSRIWTKIKHVYNRLPRSARRPYVVAVMLPGEMVSFAYATLSLRP
jgi:2-polyprenyl-3-methyl-5-hydroxy-6-metoxy-1,4-benzoquinol methylase